MQQEITYTTPVICNLSGKDTYVFFTVKFNGTTKKFKVREGINRIKDKKEKKAEAEALRSSRETWLANGWNPVTDPNFVRREYQHQSTGLQKMNFAQALLYALTDKQKTVAKGTYQQYNHMGVTIVAYSRKTGLAEMRINEVKRSDIKRLFDFMASEMKWSNHRHNQYRDTIRNLLNTLIILEIIEVNPALKIPSRSVVESNKYQALVDTEKQIVSDYLHRHHRGLWRFMQFVYHVGIRPKELCMVQVKDFNLSTMKLTLTPDLSRGNTKTKTIRHIPLNNHLIAIVNEMKLHECPPEFFVFGDPYKAEGKKRTTGHVYLKENFLTPCATESNRAMAAKAWVKIVKEKLSVSKHMYALKHTGADDKILAGMDLETLQGLYGHANKQMSAHYAKQLREMQTREIINKSPEFAKINPLKIAK